MADREVTSLEIVTNANKERKEWAVTIFGMIWIDITYLFFKQLRTISG